MTNEEIREKRLKELHQHSCQSYRDFTDFKKNEQGVVDATEIFSAKKELDQWWSDALERVNNLGVIV